MRTVPGIALTLLVCVLTGCGSSASQSSAAVIGWVVAHGGKVTVAGQSLEIKTLEDFVPGNTEVQRINLNGTNVTDKDLQNLTVLDNLEYLGLHGTRVSDAGMGSIAQIENLKELELSATDITDAGLEQLQSLTKLEKLQLHNTRVTRKARQAFQSAVPGVRISP